MTVTTTGATTGTTTGTTTGLADRLPLEQARAEIGIALRLALLLGLVVTVGAYLLLALKMEIYSLVLPTGSMSTLAGIACGFLLGAALLAALDHAREMLLLGLGHRVARRLAPVAVRAAAEARTAPGTPDAPALAAQALRDVEELRRAVSGPLTAAALDAAVAPALIILLWLISSWLAGFGLACCVIAALLSLLAERRTRGALVDSNAAAAATSAMVVDAMRSAEAVEAMGLLPALQRRWLARMAEGAGRLRTAQSAARGIAATTLVVQTLASGGALLLGAALTLNGVELGTGLLIAMLVMGKLVSPFARLASSMQDWGAARAAWARLARLLAAPPPPAQTRAFPCPEGRLVLERLTATIPGVPRPLLREISLVVAPGDVIALAGAAGSGKSTLLRLIAGARRPAAGAAFLDGHATWQWDREDFARHVGVLPQEPVLTEGTVAEAIARLGTPDMEAVLRAARLAGAERLIAGLPFGYATRIGPDTPLSMGQRQRIALARAVYGEPRLLLLDEPSAWLDEAGEAMVLRMIAALKARGAAVLLTSHRPSLLRAADRLVVLRNGMLMAAGRPQRLLPAPRRRPAPAPAAAPAAALPADTAAAPARASASARAAA
jgi:ATP-binding cassette subfamily C protein